VKSIVIYNDHSDTMKFVSTDEEKYRMLSEHMFLMTQNSNAQIRTRKTSHDFVNRKTLRDLISLNFC
jgi:hypothetical protein